MEISKKPLLPKSLDVLEIFVAEIIGTMFLVFFGCVGLLIESGSLITATVWAFTVTACVFIFGHISGAHINPAVTLCAIIHRRISLLTAFVYLIAQCIGSFIGIWLIKVMTPPAIYPDGFCTTKLHNNVTVPNGFLSEFIATSFLIWAVCVAWDPRSEKSLDSMPIKLGFVVGTAIFGLAQYSSCSMNPARSLGPAIINGKWQHQWLYWAAPLSASAVTTSFYKYTFLKKYEKGSKKSPPLTNESLMMS